MAEAGAKKRRGGSLVALLIGLVLVGGASWQAWRMTHDKDARLVTARQALAEGIARGPRVQIVTVAQGASERQITLLGDTRAYQTATLYSKVGGTARWADI